MRTTVNLDEHLLREAKRRAIQTNLSLGEFINHALRATLAETDVEPNDEFRMVTFGSSDESVKHEPRDFHAILDEEETHGIG